MRTRYYAAALRQIDGFKNRPKDTFWRLQNAFFRRFLGNTRTERQLLYSIYGPAALSNLAYSVVRADAANSDAVDLFRSAMPCVVFGEHASEVRFRRMGRRYPLEALTKYPSICQFPVFFDFQGFRAHDAHAFTQRPTSYSLALKNSAQDALLRAQNAFLRPFLRFFAWEPM